MVEAFEAEYRRIYGMAIPDVEVEAITCDCLFPRHQPRLSRRCLRRA